MLLYRQYHLCKNRSQLHASNLSATLQNRSLDQPLAQHPDPLCLPFHDHPKSNYSLCLLHWKQYMSSRLFAASTLTQKFGITLAHSLWYQQCSHPRISLWLANHLITHFQDLLFPLFICSWRNLDFYWIWWCPTKPWYQYLYPSWLVYHKVKNRVFNHLLMLQPF